MNNYTLHKTFIVLSVLCILVMSACSSKDNSASTSQPKVDICGLVSQAEMETLLGTRLKAPELQNNLICSYTSAEDAVRKTASILLRYDSATSDPAQAFTRYEADLKSHTNGKYQMQPIEGLDGTAGWNEESKQLSVFKGKFLVIVTIRLPQENQPLETARKIAEQALSRLPKP